MYPLYALSRMLSSDFTSDFQFMIITILYLLTSHFTTCVLLNQSPALILSYHEYSLLDITCYIYPPASVCFCSRHSFQCMFMIQIYRYTCAHLCTPLGIRITTRQGVLTPLDLQVQVSDRGAYGFSQLLT